MRMKWIRTRERIYKGERYIIAKSERVLRGEQGSKDLL